MKLIKLNFNNMFLEQNFNKFNLNDKIYKTISMKQINHYNKILKIKYAIKILNFFFNFFTYIFKKS